MPKTNLNYLRGHSYFIVLSLFSLITNAQHPASPSENNQANTILPTAQFLKPIDGVHPDIFGTNTKYIENIGQYGDTLARYGKMGKILFGYEGMGMPVLFTAKGLIHLQRKTKKISYDEMEELEKKELKIKNKLTTTDQVVTMEWMNGNKNPVIITEDVSKDYFTYGQLKEKAKAWKKITYKQLYPGIDLVYSFSKTIKAGFEFSLVVNAGADISKIKMRYGGDVKNIVPGKYGNLIIKSGIDEISVTTAVCYYIENNDEKFNASFVINKNEISFKLPENYNTTKTLVIDPFVSGTGTLTGSNAGKAKDIDFDYAGNIYVSGAGDGSIQKMAKFDKNGLLLWTFSGSLSIPVWNFGPCRGGWVVEKTTENIYLGEGSVNGGSRVIRLNAAGLYDNYISTANANFTENWKMLWSCNGGDSKILIAGGGGTANNELAILAPPGLVPLTSNISGLSGGHNDISDIIIDPISNDMYSIFSVSVLTPTIDSKIYKHIPPYTPADIAWSAFPGYFTLREPVNRPYNGGDVDNSSNTLAINTDYLFYWDGKNLKAFNKLTGAVAGTPISFSANTPLMKGGIAADECNNVFVGWGNGTIKVYHFDGSVFDDDAATDITITGFPEDVYDIIFDNVKGLLYACGNGFVASVDISAYCTSRVYTINTIINCADLSVVASISPAPPPGALITYNLFNNTTQIASNATGLFTGLTSGPTYTIKAIFNQACSRMQYVTNFTINPAPVLITNNPSPICSDGTTFDLTVASITTGSTAGLTFTYWLDAATTSTYPTPTIATAGTYFIKGSALSACGTAIASVTVTTTPLPIANAGADKIVCVGNNLQLSGNGGLAYNWSPSTYLSNPNISNPTFIDTVPGSIIYHLKVTDVFGCKSITDDQVKITVVRTTKVFIGNDAVIRFKQPMQLNVTDVNNSGFTIFHWSPTYGLNNPFIANPIAVLDRDQTYQVYATTVAGCQAFDTINIKVFQVPELYVPNAFTPNADGLNDVLKVIVIGIRKLRFFRIYNRYGQLIFTTSDPNKGWDGTFKGKAQDAGTYVWMVEAVDSRGNIIQQNGSSIIIQ